MRPRIAFLLLLTLAIGFTGCSSEDSPTGPATPDVAEVNVYLEGLPAWTTFSPPLPRDETEIAQIDTTMQFDGTEYDCTSTEYSLTDTPSQVTIFSPDSEIMWLGSLLQGRGYRDGLGSLAELPIRQRRPLTIFIDLLTEDVTRTVSDPTPAAVATELGALIQAATDAGHVAGSSVSFDKQTTYSLEQAALDLNISTRYLGTDVRSELSYEQSVEEHTLTAYFVQKMFTASMVLPQTPAEMFSDAFTTERLQEQVDLGRVGPANPPVYISSVVYGRMLMLTMTSTHSIQEMEAALSATNASIGGTDIDTELLEIINESRIQISTVGGVDDGVENLIRTGRLGDYFSADAPLTSARPLSYTVRNLSDSSIALVSETTTYNIRECQAVQGDPTGARYRVVLDKLRLIQDGCDGIFHPAPEVYYSYTLHYAGSTYSLGSLSAGQAVVVEEGGELTINGTARTVNLYGRGPASIRITGTAWDEDGGSNDEVIGAWDLSWTHAISSGQRYFTRSGGGCQIRLYLTITKLADLYD